MGILSCLHISDLHIGEMNNAGVEGFYTQICTDIKNNQQKIDYVVFSGDIIYGLHDNKDTLFPEAIKFFKKLLERINRTSICNKALTEENFIFVPGNHDILREKNDIYSLYKKFLEEFYGKTTYEKLYNQEHLYTLRIDKEKKIAIVGLNSCAIKKAISEKDKKWIENLPFKENGITATAENKVKKLLISSKEEIDDYGEISVDQLNEAFDELQNEIGDLSEYRILATFHHHIYPFPEIYSKYGDSSMIRNFAVVIDYFLSRHVSIILHGHKHTSISRPITNNKFYIDPKRMIHVFSAGSIGSDRGSRSYQIVEIHSPNDTIDVQATKYIYEGIEFQNAETITFPPKETNLIATFNIIDILKARNYDLHGQYTRLVLLKDKKSEQYRVSEIINDISNTITTFKDIRNYLERQPDVIFILLLSIHYRILVQDGVTQNKKMLEQIKKALKSISNIEEDYANEIFDLLQTIKGNIYLKKYKAIQEKLDYHKYKKETAYIVTTTHLLDLYLSLGYYGEVYFKREGLQSKVNFKLEDEIFNENLPTPFLKITGEEDRRTATIAFKCLNPTVHKTAVLIVKDFEEKISKIEDSFKEIGLKIYYIRPKVNPDGYELENYSFEAYIPKLLPLLTGEHLYKQKEVFVRELIQNSLDAILLRTKLDTTEFNKDILITIGQVEKEGKPVKYLKIQDFGVGMDQYKIERYFTSIGRSFYTSDDYIELLQEKKINFKAVSNFGIGFLSVFMVCNSVKVWTKSYDKEKDAIEMEIPNYEGCFFVKKNEVNSTIGTEITLFEGDKKKINHKHVIKYLTENILNIDLNISLKNEIEDQSIFIEKNGLLKDLVENSKDFLFIPINSEGLVNVNYDEMVKNIEKYKYGILINLNGNGRSILMNSGIRVTARTKGLKIGIDDNYFDSDSPFDLYYFFPSSFIQLDVSRERILSFKSKESDSIIHKTASTILNTQARDFINLSKKEKKDIRLSIINDIKNLLGNKGKNPIIEKEMLWISLYLNKDNKIELSLIPEDECLNPDCFYTCDGKLKNIQVFEYMTANVFKELLIEVDMKYKKAHKNIEIKDINDFNIESNIFGSIDKYALTKYVKDYSFHQRNLFSSTQEEVATTMNFLIYELIKYSYHIESNNKGDIIKFDDVAERIFDRFYHQCCSIVTFRDIHKIFLIQPNKKNKD